MQARSFRQPYMHGVCGKVPDMLKGYIRKTAHSYSCSLFLPSGYIIPAKSSSLMDDSSSFDERLRITGRIFQSVGISAVIWGSDALHHHGIFTVKNRNDIIVPNEDFLRAAEVLRLHQFTAIDPIIGSAHYLEGLDHYAAQYTYPPEVTERLGSDVTIALYPASLMGWKLVYVPIPNPEQLGSFTTALTVQKLPTPAEPLDVEQSFIQLSMSISDVDDAISVASDVKIEEDDDYIFVESDMPRYISAQQRRASVAMERGNGNKSPSDSISQIIEIKDEKTLAKTLNQTSSPSFHSCGEIADKKPELGTGAVEMLPGQKLLEKSEGQLFMMEKALYVPRKEFFRGSIKNARDFLRRDGNDKTKLARILEGWELLLG